MAGDEISDIPVVILDLHMVPLTIRYTSDYLDINLSSLLTPGGKHKFYSFILNGEGDKIMLPIVSPIVEEQARLLNGCKLQLKIEFKALC